MTTQAPKTDDAAAHRLSQAIDRLIGEWREIRPLIGLRTASTWAEIAKALTIDRGTAQRLVKLGRSVSVSLSDLALVPGAAAWQKIVRGVELRLGAEHAMCQRLASACDRYEECLNAFGGSRAAATRALAHEPSSALNPNDRDGTRQRLVETMASYMGFSVDLRLDLLLMRLAPHNSTRIDLVMVQCFLGCTGRAGAVPFAHSRHGCASDGSPVQSSAETDGRSFILLSSGTSSPLPGLLTTGDSTSQTIIVEPNWTERGKPMDLSIMQVERDAQDSPWLEKPFVYSAETLNRYPTRRLILQRLIHRDLHLDATAHCSAFLTRRVVNLQRPWFDRLPEPAELVYSPPPFARAAPIDFPSYSSIVGEVFRRLEWDPEPFHAYQMDVTNPVPLAWYSFELEREG